MEFTSTGDRPGMRRITSDDPEDGRDARVPIRTKLVLGVMALFIVPSVFLGILLPRWQGAQATAHVEEKARTLVQLLAHGGAPAVARGDREGVRRAMAGAFNLSEILVVRVRGEEGRALFTYDPLSTELPGSGAPGTVRRTDDVVLATEVIHDGDGTAIGELTVALGLSGVRSEARRSRWMGLGAGLLILLLGVPLAFGLAHHITGPITEVAGVVSGIQGGEEWDLTRRVSVDAGDETGELADGVNRFLAELEALVRAVQRSAFDTDRDTEAIEEASARLATSADALGAAIVEISEGSAAQVEATAKNAEGARSARELAERILERAEETAETTHGVTRAAGRGREASAQATAAMDRIAAETRGSRRVVATLEDNAAEIDRILEAIDAISRQTRLLAFNASIEAVREGSRDSGFSVVVDEVGKLAVATRGHAREIGDAVSAIGASVEATVERVERIEAAVKAGRRVISELESILGDVDAESGRTARAVERIADLGEEQRRSLAEVVEHAENVARIAEDHETASARMAGAVESQQNAVAETTGLATELSELAADLAGKIRKFRVAASDAPAPGAARPAEGAGEASARSSSPEAEGMPGPGGPVLGIAPA